MIDRAASLQPARAPKHHANSPDPPCEGRGRYPEPEEERVCLPSGSVGSILGKAMSTTGQLESVKQTNKQTKPPDVRKCRGRAGLGKRQMPRLWRYQQRALSLAMQACRPESQKFNISSRSATTKASLSAKTELRCRAYNGLARGLSKAGKVALVNKCATSCTRPVTTSTGGWSPSGPVFSFIKAARRCSSSWAHETNYLGNSLQPPPNVLHAAVHKFTPRDVDTATLEVMVEQGELPGALQRFAPRSLGIGDEVELLVQMPTDRDRGRETKNEWINQKATIVKVEAGRYLVHVEADLANDKKVA